jgi:aspartate-semialdehyde dehydrogenase
MGWTNKKPSQKIVVGLVKTSSLFDENLQMVYLIHQLSFGESMVKYTQKVMN